MIEEAWPARGGFGDDALLLAGLIKLVRWTHTGDVQHLPEHGAGELLNPGRPSQLHDSGADAWVRHLTHAAWQIVHRGGLTTVLIASLIEDTASWVVNTSDGIVRLDAMVANIRERLLPWLLGGVDPMPVYEDFLRGLDRA
jgi:hypothetical protein